MVTVGRSGAGVGDYGVQAGADDNTDRPGQCLVHRGGQPVGGDLVDQGLVVD